MSTKWIYSKYCLYYTQNTLTMFLSAITAMQVIFWIEGNFCFTSDCRYFFNCKVKKFINEQITNFYSPSNAFVHLANPYRWNILASYFRWYMFSFHLVQYTNTKFMLMKTHLVFGAVYMRWNISPRWDISSEWDTFHPAFSWETYPIWVRYFSSRLDRMPIFK